MPLPALKPHPMPRLQDPATALRPKGLTGTPCATGRAAGVAMAVATAFGISTWNMSPALMPAGTSTSKSRPSGVWICGGSRAES
eukprot:scaffold3589_cov132-Isochrysis_galbana.AAC.2